MSSVMNAQSRKCIPWLPIAAAVVVAVMVGPKAPRAGSCQADANTVAVVPARVLDLTNWKLTLSVDSQAKGTPDEILQPALATFQHASCFRVNEAKDGVVFRAHCGGVTTRGSSYPRSELRQMNGKELAGWSTTAGTHTMTLRQAITHLPAAKPHVVAGQIHDDEDDVIVVRLEGSKLFFDENGKDGPVLTKNYKLGDVFTIKFVAHDGSIDCHYNDKFIYTYSAKAKGCYFKAGCYTQSNVKKGDDAEAYGEVVIYDLTVTSTP